MVERSYFSQGSIAYCLLADGEPVFAGGIVTMHWNRGEAWMLPTPFFKSHTKTCFRYMRNLLRVAVVEGNFRRVQVTCSIMVSTLLFEHLGFGYEGTLKGWGPSGETCYVYARLF